MAPPIEDRPRRLPTLSWESVVDDAEQAAVAAAPEAPLVPPAPPAVDADGEALASPATPPAEPITFSATLDVSDALVRSTPPSQVIPAIGDLEIGPASVSPVSDDVPTIIEATPVPPTESSLESSLELPEIAEATPAADTAALGPRLPAVVEATPSPTASVPVVVEATPAPISPAHRRRRSRGGLKLVLALIVIGGMVAAGVVYGMPYLFPDEWDATSAPYGEAVEAASGVEFVEPVTVTLESSAELAQRRAAELLVGWEDAQPQWRALGLSSGVFTADELAGTVADWRSAVYVPADGQIYADADASASDHDAQITQAVAAASLDQQYEWSAEQAERTLDDRAATTAEVLRQVGVIQEESDFGTEVAPVDPSRVDALPPVLGYQLLAPHVFAEFANVNDAETNVLDDLGTAGPGPFVPERPVLASQAQMIGTDTAATGPVAMDRSLWYLSMAAFLDPATAYAASESIVENAVTMAERGATDCVYATFSGGDVGQNATLRPALEQWSASAPAEYTSSFSVLADGSLQLVTCDPGASAPGVVRPGVARELVNWRLAELATIEAVVVGGSTDLEPDLAGALPFVLNSSAVADLGALPADTPPAALADSARASVRAIFAPGE